MNVKGKLQKIRTGGYPSEYKGLSAALLPLLQDLKQNHSDELFCKFQERIDICPSDAELFVELWNLS